MYLTSSQLNWQADDAMDDLNQQIPRLFAKRTKESHKIGNSLPYKIK